MSGPKFSRPRLTAVERRRLEQERKRRIEEERLRQEQAKMDEIDQYINQNIPKIEALKKKMEDVGVRVAEEATEVLGDHPSIDMLVNEKQQAIVSIEEFPKNYQERNLSKMQAYEQKLSKLLRQLQQTLNSDLLSLIEEIETAVKTKKLIDAEQDFFSRTQNIEIKSQAKVNLTLGKNNRDVRAIEEQLVQFHEAVTPYIKNEYLKENKKEIESFFSSTNAMVINEKIDRKYRLSQLNQRLKAFLSTKIKYDQEIEINQKFEQDYRLLLLDYQTLCQMLNKESVTEQFLVEKAEEQVNRLKNEVSTLEKQLRDKEETDYITNSVNEIMTSLGYDVVSSDTMQTTKRRIVQQLYDFGDNSVINVSSSDDGSLLFQVAGTSNGSKQEVSSLEKLKIMEDMDDFCEEYSFIKDELRKKGIELTNEDLKPTSEEYVNFIDLSKRKNVRGENRRKKNLHTNQFNKNIRMKGKR